ncbi:methylated-DNA--[protein]-cysteine S-methyltransferase [Chloroflexota bacterium]
MEYYYHVFNTGKGWVAILGSTRGLVSVTPPRSSAQGALDYLGRAIEQAAPSPERFRDLTRRLQDYFSGHKVLFPDKLDLASATPFQRVVWQATRLIAYGETRSYGWLADKVSRPGAARAIGHALSKNPLPIIVPCHRVIGGNGSLGGFSDGLEMKRRLLHLEAATTSPQR